MGFETWTLYRDPISTTYPRPHTRVAFKLTSQLFELFGMLPYRVLCAACNISKLFFQVHRVDNVQTANASLQCCSINLISKQKSCCNGNAYDPAKEVCADIATTSLGDSILPRHCGEGTVCPLRRAMFAACDR